MLMHDCHFACVMLRFFERNLVFPGTANVAHTVFFLPGVSLNFCKIFGTGNQFKVLFPKEDRRGLGGLETGGFEFLAMLYAHGCEYATQTVLPSCATALTCTKMFIPDVLLMQGAELGILRSRIQAKGARSLFWTCLPLVVSALALSPDMPCTKRVYEEKKVSFHWSAAMNRWHFSSC